MSSVHVLWQGTRKSVQVRGGYGAPVHVALAAATAAFGLPGVAHTHYQLKHKRKDVDLALTLSQAGVPNNAELELVRAQAGGGGSPVQIALSLPDGSRVQGTTNSSSTLRGMLELLRVAVIVETKKNKKI